MLFFGLLEATLTHPMSSSQALCHILGCETDSMSLVCSSCQSSVQLRYHEFGLKPTHIRPLTNEKCKIAIWIQISKLQEGLNV